MKTKLTLVFIVGMIGGYFAGREHLKYELRSAASEAAKSIQQSLKRAFSTDEKPDKAKVDSERSLEKTLEEERRALEEATAKANQDQEAKRIEALKRAADEKKVKDSYAKEFLTLSDIESSYQDDRLDGRVPCVFGNLKNIGDRTLKRVEVTTYFLDSDGKEIFEKAYNLVTDRSFDDNSPLKPNYVRKIAWKFKNVPVQWAEGKVRVACTDLEFVP
jgi:hypothetical protein